MSARHKLNAANFYGGLLVAGTVGLLSRSWTLFALAAVVIVATSVHSGDIRLKPRPRYPRPRR